MDHFTRLFTGLDQTTRINEKVALLEAYFRKASNADAAWALQFLSGKTLPRVVPTRQLWNWAAEVTRLPPWLMDECYEAVGDLAEMLALLLPDNSNGTSLSLAELVQSRLLPLKELPELSRRELLLQTWRELSSFQRLVWNKLITGAFRVGVSRTLVIRALASVAGIEPAVMAHRVLGNWQPTPQAFAQLLAKENAGNEIARPYPFFLASPIETKIKPSEDLETALGSVSDWQVEWKWDGIRAQIIRRAGETCIWSRGDEMITDTFPEIAEAAEGLPNGTVLDGEILAWRENRVQPFGTLQRRLGRKRVTGKMREDFPVAFIAFDLLEIHGADIRSEPLLRRREELEAVIKVLETTALKLSSPSQAMLSLFPEPDRSTSASPIRLAPLLAGESWEALRQLQSQAREESVEGLMLKRRNSPYGVGRPRGDWWKWKIAPFVIDAVLIAAQPGHGRRANLYTDYTFGVWDDGKLVPVAKAYSGLTDEEIGEVDAFVRRHSGEKHGPVRMVKPELVFELAFEGIQASPRHKSGIAVRFPRMSRWRKDKKPDEADTLENLKALLHASKTE